MPRYHLPSLLAREDHALTHRMIAAGKLVPGNVFIDLPDDFDWQQTPKPQAVWSPPPRADAPEEPTARELVENFGGAMLRWAQAGFPVLNQEQYDARTAACEPCEHWDAKAYFGSGKCRLCGCSKKKRWLATEQCPHPAGSRWEKLNKIVPFSAPQNRSITLP